MRRLTGSTLAKIMVFFLMTVGAATAVAGAVICYINAELGVYEAADERAAVTEMLRPTAYSYAYEVKAQLADGAFDAARAVVENTNAAIQVLAEEDRYSSEKRDILWQTGEVGEDWIVQDIVMDFKFLSHPEGSYVFRVCFQPDFPVRDEVRQNYWIARNLYESRYMAIVMFLSCSFFCIACFVFLLCSAGHKNGREGITPSVLGEFHFDILTGIFLAVMCLGGIIIGEAIQTQPGSYLVTAAIALAGSCLLWTLAMLYLMELATRLKQGGFWRNTLIYTVMCGSWRALKTIAASLWRLFQKIPLVPQAVIWFFIISLGELIYVAGFSYRSDRVIFWFLERVVLFAGVLYLAIVCKKLLFASEAMAEGEENYVVDTSYMIGDFRKHGENLNSLSQGIAKAVAERMKSERLKTELITNVSHDLKTPLTSIINYTDLICGEESENPKIAEYAEVLLRQSGRLKKLLEDLVEASKATTGNLEVRLEECEAGVLLIQAAGEYEQKMTERQLELRTRQPEEAVRIMADGRHLWRVFDNLLNNICKYAQEGSRVYLSVEKREKKVAIVFRNMSKYALNISAEELEERFVRGDRSRHMEGNGLGLSIAKSLTELQGGEMKVSIDGDLFKVELCFDEVLD